MIDSCDVSEMDQRTGSYDKQDVSVWERMVWRSSRGRRGKDILREIAKLVKQLG